MAGWRAYQRLTLVSRTIASSAAAENQAMLPWPRGTTMNAASSGPIADPVAAAQAGTATARSHSVRRRPCGRRAKIRDGRRRTPGRPSPRRQDHWIAVGDRQQQQAEQAAAHGDRKGERLRPLVGHHADDRLQQRRGQLKCQGDQADLPEVQPIGVLQDRVDRRDQRLVHVIQKVAEAQRHQDRECRAGVGVRVAGHAGDRLG